MDVCTKGELHALGLQLFGDMPGIENRSDEAVKLGYHHGVALAHGGHGLVQNGPCAASVSQPLVHINGLRRAAELGEHLSLCRQFLFVGGTA